MTRTTKWTTSSLGGLVRAAAVLCVAGSAGCFATIDGDADVEAEVPVVHAEVVPVEVVTYPRYVYRGETVYLVEGRWYARRGSHWVIYRREPRELGRYRIEYERARPRRVYR